MIETMHTKPDVPEAEPQTPTRLKTTTTVPIERREIVIRPPRGWVRISIAAVEVAFMSWALPVAVALVAFLLTASNPWMMEVDWNSAIGIGADAWALSYFSPLTVSGVSIDLIPLGLTLLHFGLARIGLWRAKAESWTAAAFFIPVYIATVAVLSALSHTHSHLGWTVLGALVIVTLAWLSAFSQWDERPPWWDRVDLYRRGVVDGLILTALIGCLGLVSLVVGIVSAWSRVLSVQELLHASVGDLVLAWLAQLAYLPNLVAAVASWVAGPGFFTGIHAVHTPSRSPVEPIPSVPVLGALPHTTIGIWVVAIPIVLGVVFSFYFIRRRREESLVGQLTHAATALVVVTVVTTLWMWLSTGGVWSGRMALFGPRWAFSGVLLALEVAGSALFVSVVSHPEFLVRVGMREPSGDSGCSQAEGSFVDEDGNEGSLMEESDEESSAMVEESDVDADEVDASAISQDGEAEGSAIADTPAADSTSTPAEVLEDSAQEIEDETIHSAPTPQTPAAQSPVAESNAEPDPDHDSPTEDGDEYH